MKAIYRFHSNTVKITVFFLVSIFVISNAQDLKAGSNLYGILGKGYCLTEGLGTCSDAGNLISIDRSTRAVDIVGDTGLRELNALAYDIVNHKLIAGGKAGVSPLEIGIKIYEINPTNAIPTEIVSRLLDDPTPPSDLIGVFRGILQLSALEFHPITGDLYSVISDGEGDFLARLDLNSVDNAGNLEIDLIGAIGKGINIADPFGFYGTGGIAFKQSTAELVGMGTKLPTSPDNPEPYWILINTTYVPIPDFASGLMQSGVFINNALAMASDPTGTFDDIYAAGRVSSSGTPIQKIIYLSTGGTEYHFTSLDFDADVTGLTFIPESDPLPPRLPEIASFSPRGGNTGISVTIRGTGFTQNAQPNIKNVFFNGIPVIGSPVVVSDEVLKVIAPNAPTGPIEVVTFTDSDGDGSEDSALSDFDFIRSELHVLNTLFNQGIPYYEPISGKDAVFRLYTASSASTDANTIPVTFETASLYITKPESGEVVEVPASFYTKIFTNTEYNMQTTERHNINFYINGDNLEEIGEYELRSEVRDITGSLIYSQTRSKELKESPLFHDEFRVLVVVGAVGASDNIIWPDIDFMEHIPKVFSELSRVLPVRNGVSRLGDDLTAGIRFDISSQGIVLGKDFQSVDLENVWDSAQERIELLRKLFNSSNSDKAQYVTVFGEERLRDPQSKASGLGDFYGNKSISLFRSNILVIPIHEFGHNLGLVSEDSPNYDAEDGNNHSTNHEFPPNVGAYLVQAFNVPEHRALIRPPDPGAPPDYIGYLKPLSIMHYSVLGDRDWQYFLETYEFQGAGCCSPLIGSSFLSGGSFLTLSEMPTNTFSIIARISDDDSANIIQSYISDINEPYTEIDPSSPYSLVFLDNAGTILSQDYFPMTYTISDSVLTSKRLHSSIISLVRPLPNETSQVQLRKDSQVLASINRSLNAPDVHIISPSGGEIIGENEKFFVQWTAYDPDNNPLTYNISYSPDGIRWVPITAGINETSITWDTSLSAGTNNGQIRVTASDGFNTTSTESQIFAVANKTPMISIIYPSDGANIQQFDLIPFEAIVFDMESGILDGTAIQWFSSKNGKIGTGRSYDLAPGTLSPGTHIITVSANDGSLNISKAITITILSDADRDGLSDNFENLYDTQNPLDPYDAGKDEDGDGLNSLQEATAGTNPENNDTDNDGMPDGQEITEGRNPTIPESIILNISGGAYNYPEGSRYRASFSTEVTTDQAISSGWLKYYYTRRRMSFVSDGITAVSVSGNTAIISGTGSVNGENGYKFDATVSDGDPDSFGITIFDATGNIFYSAGFEKVSGGNLSISEL